MNTVEFGLARYDNEKSLMKAVVLNESSFIVSSREKFALQPIKISIKKILMFKWWYDNKSNKTNQTNVESHRRNREQNHNNINKIIKVEK